MTDKRYTQITVEPCRLLQGVELRADASGNHSVTLSFKDRPQIVIVIELRTSAALSIPCSFDEDDDAAVTYDFSAPERSLNGLLEM